MTGADARSEAEPDPMTALGASPGLCATCRHAAVTRARRSLYLRCGLAAVDPRFPRYPRLPVRECAGYHRRGDEG